MDITRAIGYPFKDGNAIVKILIGTVINLIPIVNFISYGYSARVVKEVMAGREEAMPEWDDWGGDFMRGLMLFLGYLLYFLPSFILSCCSNVFSAAAGEDGAAIATLNSDRDLLLHFYHHLGLYGGGDALPAFGQHSIHHHR